MACRRWRLHPSRYKRRSLTTSSRSWSRGMRGDTIMIANMMAMMVRVRRARRVMRRTS